MKTLQSIFILIILSFSANISAQKAESSNYSLQVSGFTTLGVSPSNMVGSSNYLLQESNSEFYTCPITTGNQYVLLPGMIFPQNTPPAYCTENLYETGCTAGDYISNYIFGDITNLNSGCSDGGYGDFTDLSTNLVVGNNYQLTIQTGYSNQYASMWIDFNDNFAFEESENILNNFFIDIADTNYTIEINIPENAGLGEHRLRVRTNWNYNSDAPCELFTYGETEDYSVNIIPYSEYCTENLYVTGCIGGDYIDNYIFGDITNLNSGCSDGGYGDFTDLSTNLVVGNNYQLTIQTGYSNQYASMWIDFNDNFAFEESENILNNFFIDIADTNYTIEINIPENAGLGEHRLRVRTNWNNNSDAPCALFTFGETEDYTVTIIENQIHFQNIALNAGWNGISSYLDLEDIGIENTFQPINNYMIIVQNNTGVYWPAQEINTLNNWNPNIGYEVKMNLDQTLELSGSIISQATVDVNQGWNLIPVLSPCQANTEVLFSNIQDDILLVKEVAGTGVYWPEYNINSLEMLHPGKSYHAYFHNQTTLNYSACENGDGFKNEINTKHPNLWKPVNATPYTHTIALDPSISNKDLGGKWLAAFTSAGKCAGAMELNQGNQVLVIFGDDPLTTQKEGFAENEPITLMICSEANRMGMEIKSVYDDDHRFASGNFESHGISVLKNLEVNPGHISQNSTFSTLIYPNPAKDRLSIKSELALQHMKVLNFNGEILIEKALNNRRNYHLDIEFLPSGIYTIVFIGESKISTEKFVKTK